MNEVPLSELPRVLSRPPWMMGRPSRFLTPVRVSVKPLGKALAKEKVAAHVAKLKAGEDQDVDSTDVALALFDATSVFGGWRSDFNACAWRYYGTYVEATLAGIIPIAVGESGPRRKIAERIVRQLAVAHASIVRAASARYGKRVVASVEEILEVDRRFDCPNTAPEMPATFAPEKLPRPRLHDGRELPLFAVQCIAHMLAFSSLERPYVGLEDVRGLCEPRSLAELAWDLARAWDGAGGAHKDRWMVESIAHLGDDALVRRTTPALTQPYVIDVLGHIGTNAAAVELCTIAWRLTHDKPSSSFTTRAVAAAFANVARKRGMTVDDLEEALVPTSLPSDGAAPASMRLPKPHAKVGVDDRLDPFIQTQGGTRLNELPHKLARAEEIWRDLHEDVAAIADVRTRALERALISGRTWTLDAFRRAWMDHPLMRHAALGIVWRSDKTAFRIAEDGTFANAVDKPVEGVGVIGIAHPVEMTADEAARWIGVLADYRIVQPIDQMSRRTLRDAKGTSLVLMLDAAAPQREVLDRLGRAGFLLDWRANQSVATRVGARSAVRLALTLHATNQIVDRLTLTAERGGKSVPLAQVHPVDLSELAHDAGAFTKP